MKRIPIDKQTRWLVYNKCNGHCAYCGCYLPYKDMQIDHVFPVSRSHMRFHKESVENINSIDNLMPSCRSCNYYKRTRTLEEYRHNLTKVAMRLRSGKAGFLVRLAERYGIVKIKQFSGKFYFERMQR